MVQVSSTGSLGETVRSDERVYMNFPEFVEEGNVSDFRNEVVSFLDGRESEKHLTRSVVRAVVDTDTAEELLSDKFIFNRVEAATPIQSTDDSGTSTEHLIYIAENRQDRKLTPAAKRITVNKVRNAVNYRQNNSAETSNDIGNVSNVRDIREVSDPVKLHSIWGTTFGWSLEGCKEFAEQIKDEAGKPPAERSIWYQGIETLNGDLLASAMAERLDMPSREGSTIALVESTEWSAAASFRGRGIGTLVVRSLTGNVKHDLETVDHLVFAECNIISGAHMVALRAGYEVPQVKSIHGLIGQVLFKNVRIGDGYQPENQYRNFMFTVAK